MSIEAEMKVWELAGRVDALQLAFKVLFNELAGEVPLQKRVRDALIKAENDAPAAGGVKFGMAKAREAMGM